jgi:hypothetical protein
MPLALIYVYFRQIRFHSIPKKGTQTLSNERLKSTALSAGFWSGQSGKLCVRLPKKSHPK